MAAQGGARTDRESVLRPALALVAALVAAGLVAQSSMAAFALAVAAVPVALLALLLPVVGRRDASSVPGMLAFLLAGAAVGSAFGGVSPAVGMVLTAVVLAGLLTLWPSHPARASALVAAGLLLAGLVHRLT